MDTSIVPYPQMNDQHKLLAHAHPMKEYQDSNHNIVSVHFESIMVVENLKYNRKQNWFVFVIHHFLLYRYVHWTKDHSTVIYVMLKEHLAVAHLLLWKRMDILSILRISLTIIKTLFSYWLVFINWSNKKIRSICFF
jgi:hypothetical protein